MKTAKTKVVKAWIQLFGDGSYRVEDFKMKHSKFFPDSLIVPCTISFTIPKKTK